jgi:mono/diheme cytochrome c family protein
MVARAVMKASRTLLVSATAVAAAAVASPQDPSPRDLYRAKCQACHMADGNAPIEAMNFAGGAWKHGSKAQELAKVIAEGVQGTAMLPFKSQLTPEQIKALADYVRSFDPKLKSKPKK